MLLFVTLFTLHSLITTLVTGIPAPQSTPPAPQKWTLVQQGTTGVNAMQLGVVSSTLAIIFDRVEKNPLQVNGHPAWAALYNLKTHKVTPLDMKTNSFCAGGSFLSNGSLVNVGGNGKSSSYETADGWQGLRLFNPCKSANGTGCTVYENPSKFKLKAKRWYPSAVRIRDGSVMAIGGATTSGFYNYGNVPSYEFFPPKGNGNPIHSPFLNRTGRANLFPIAITLPDGTIFMVASNQAIIYNITSNKEKILPNIPKDVRVTYPFTGSAALLPLSPPNYTPEVLICGGSKISDKLDPSKISVYEPASQFCFRLLLTTSGIAAGWRTETMPERRVMPDLVLMPNGQVIMVNGAQSGAAGYGNVYNQVGASNAANPAFTPVLYTPTLPSGQRFDKTLMPTSNIPRMYHSTATLTPMGNIMIAGSNPNDNFSNKTFPTEYRAEWLNPPYMSAARPVLSAVPEKLLFGKQYNVTVNIPSGLSTANSAIKVALMDLGFATHSIHMGNRLVFLTFTLAANKKSILVTAPPNGGIYPPGPGFLYITVDNVTSEGAMVMVGSGAKPPIAS